MLFLKTILSQCAVTQGEIAKVVTTEMRIQITQVLTITANRQPQVSPCRIFLRLWQPYFMPTFYPVSPEWLIIIVLISRMRFCEHKIREILHFHSRADETQVFLDVPSCRFTGYHGVISQRDYILIKMGIVKTDKSIRH